MCSAVDGKTRYDIIAAQINSGLNQILGQFSEKEQNQLADLLERFVVAVDHYVDSEVEQSST